MRKSRQRERMLRPVFDDDAMELDSLSMHSKPRVGALGHGAFGESLVVTENVEESLSIRIGSGERHRTKF